MWEVYPRLIWRQKVLCGKNVQLGIYRPVSQYRMNSEEVPDSSIVNLGVVLRNVLLANSA